jgi:TniQ
MTPATRRWPLHPPPGPGEALTSWTARLAGLYGMTAGYLLRHNLGEASALMDDPRSADLDFDPPAGILRTLAERTGTSLGVVRMMTLAGWVPWLADTLDPSDGQEAFHTYVRQSSVLLAPREAGVNSVPRWLPWMSVRGREWRTERRACPQCAAIPGRGTSLLAALPLLTTCGEHSCRLVPGVSLLPGTANHPAAQLAPGPVAAVDRLTWEGMTTGMVTLPRRAVHVGVWLRMLRALLDEVSLPESRVRRRSVAALSQVWEATGLPPRAGLGTWRPYEALAPQYQEAMMEAAACVLDLIQAGRITACGTLGHLLTPEPHRDVYEGDQRAWELKQARAELHAVFIRARHDPATARRVLEMFTVGSRTVASFYRERHYLTMLGIPAELLPDHWELGRTDLRP